MANIKPGLDRAVRAIPTSLNPDYDPDSGKGFGIGYLLLIPPVMLWEMLDWISANPLVCQGILGTGAAILYFTRRSAN